MTQKAAQPHVVVYRLLNKAEKKADGEQPYPARVILRTEDVILDKGKSTTIRYIEGVPTIRKSAQKDIDQGFRKTGSVTFLGGELEVDVRNETLIEYLDNCNANASNENRINKKPPLFYKVEREKEVEQEFAAITLEAEAREKAWNDTEEHMLQYAVVLGIPTSKMTVNEVRVAYMKSAGKNPKAFLDGFDSASSKVKYLVLNAMRSGHILTNDQEIMWKEGGKIAKAPKNENATEFLVAYAMKDKELLKRLEGFTE